MKLSLLVSIFLILVAGPAGAAVPGSIGVFADAGGTNCNVFDTGGLVQVHLVHVHTDGATASQFMLDVSAAGWTYLGDIWNFQTAIGNSVTGVSIAYHACLTSPIHLGVVSFLGTSAPPCTEIRIVPDPIVAEGQIWSVDCEPIPLTQKHSVPGGKAIVNGNSSCSCSVPIEEKTWGGIKALYR